MKFDPFKWQQVKPNAENKAPQGLLHIMCSEEATVYVQCQGYEAIAGTGKEVKVSISEEFRFRVMTSEGADVFVFAPAGNSHEATGEVFTNIDRMPMESGTMLEITKALRLFKLEQSQMRARLCKEEDEQRARIAAMAEPDPIQEPAATDPAQEPSPTGETVADPAP